MTDKRLKEGLTYDDVLVIPSYSEVLPNKVSTSTQFTKNIRLKIPVISAAMDTDDAQISIIQSTEETPALL